MSWPGPVAFALIAILARGGAALSVFASAERLTGPQAEAGLTVAALAERVRAAHPGVGRVRRAPSGRIAGYWFDEGAQGRRRDRPGDG